MWSDINDAMVLWVQQLHAAGFKTAILSNMPTDMATHVRNNFAWISHFDHHIFSGEVRSVKPEPAIYQHCIDALGVQPSEALFIDDRDVNLEQARADWNSRNPFSVGGTASQGFASARFHNFTAAIRTSALNDAAKGGTTWLVNPKSV